MMRWVMMAIWVAAAVAIYITWIRPKLIQNPRVAWLFERERSIWEKLKGWFTESKMINWGNLQIGAGTLLNALDQIKALNFQDAFPGAGWVGLAFFAMGVVTILLRLMTVGATGEQR